MPLIKRREITGKQLSANRRNITLSHGPITPEGRERIRSAHIRHGFYAADIETSMRALGEDPAHLEELTEGLWAECDPQGSMQEGLVIRLARATWLMNRADRMQQGYAMRRARDLNMGRDDRSHANMMRLKVAADSLRRLAQSVQREHYVTTRADLELMKNLQQETILKDMGEIALTLFYQLQAPGTGEDGIDPEEKSRRALVKFKAIFGLGGDEPPKPKSALTPSQLQETPKKSIEAVIDNRQKYPSIAEAEWERRERPRQLLVNILMRQVETCEALGKAERDELRKGPSPFERAAEIAPTLVDSRLMRRMQDSNFREVRRLTNLLLKLKRSAWNMKAHKNDEGDGERVESSLEGVEPSKEVAGT
jgi:hypothetical protein